MRDIKVSINYSEFPELIKSGILKISEDQYIKIFVTEDSTDINIEVKDNSFGGEYLNNFVLDYDTAKDFYNILYHLLKQVNNK